MGIFLAIIFSFLSNDVSAELKTIKAKLGAHTIQIQIVEKEEERAKGLMHVREMPDNHGMLFVFAQEFMPTFWMKNTLIPLAIAFIDTKFRIADIQEMVPPKSVMDLNIPKYASRKPAILALEMNATWFKRHSIKEGEELRFLSPVPTPLLKRLHAEARPKSK